VYSRRKVILARQIRFSERAERRAAKGREWVFAGRSSCDNGTSFFFKVNGKLWTRGHFELVLGHELSRRLGQSVPKHFGPVSAPVLQRPARAPWRVVRCPNTYDG
jgi:hypothetical protein